MIQIQERMIIRKHAADGASDPGAPPYQDLGVILHVDNETQSYCWIPIPETAVIARAPLANEGEKLESKTRRRHHIKAPRWTALGDLREQISAGTITLIVQQREPWRTLTDYALSMPYDKWHQTQLEAGVSDRRRLARQKAIRDKQFEWIKPLLDQSERLRLLDSHEVSQYARLRSVEIGVPAPAIVRAVRAYLLWGEDINALLPAYGRCNTSERKNHIKRPGRRPRVPYKGRNPGGFALSDQDKNNLGIAWRRYKKDRGHTAKVAYTAMLRQYYSLGTTTDGADQFTQLKCPSEMPTPRQFKWHGPRFPGNKTARRINLGERVYQLTQRGMRGSARDGVRSAGQIVQMDSTPVDVTLVSAGNRMQVLQQPVLTMLIDTASEYILGISCSFRTASAETACAALGNAILDKKEFCLRWGVEIEDEDWLSVDIKTIRTDNGEMKSESFMNACQKLLITTHFVKSKRPDQKGIVEKANDRIGRISAHLTEGTTFGKARERCEKDCADKAAWTFEEFMPVLIEAVMYTNNHEPVDRLLTAEMRAAGVRPYRRDILKWMKTTLSNSRTQPNRDESFVRAITLSRFDAVIRADGVRVVDPFSERGQFLYGLKYSSQKLFDSGILDRARRRAIKASVWLDPGGLESAWYEHPIHGVIKLDYKGGDSSIRGTHLEDVRAIAEQALSQARDGEADDIQNFSNHTERTHKQNVSSRENRNALMKEAKETGVKPAKPSREGSKDATAKEQRRHEQQCFESLKQPDQPVSHEPSKRVRSRASKALDQI